MEPVTHFLTGACIGRAGLNRKTAYATLAAVLAAEAADLDVLWSLAGPVEQLRHHRGITHTLIGAPVVAGVVVGVVWLWERWQRSRKSQAKATKREQQAIHFGWLYLTALIAAFSHILLDWTNNYGVRPFFPFNARWYEGSIIFIAEPAIWALLLLALTVPWILGLTDREIGARRQRFSGQGWAIFALLGIVSLWCWRGLEQAEGYTMLSHTQVASELVLRVALEPYPINPYHWHAILETRDFYQTAEVNTWNPSSPTAIDSDPRRDVMYKPADTPAVEAAKGTLVGKVFQDWGSWVVIEDAGQQPVPGVDPPQLVGNRSWTTVKFSDLRFLYSFIASRPSGRAPLSGWAYIVDGHEEAAEGMGGKEQR